MRLQTKVILSFLIMTVSSCGGSSTTEESFPDYSTIAKQVAPMLPAAVASLQETYTDPTEWSTYDAYGRLKDVLGDPDEDPRVITKMYILIDMAQSAVNDVNANYVDANGGFINCTQISSSSSVLTPWFSANDKTPFFSYDDTKDYQCYVKLGESNYIFFGKAQSSGTGCENKNVFSIMTGNKSTSTNTEQVATRGTTVTISHILKAKYDECSKDLHVVYAQRSKYATSVAFNSRSELTGNADTHLFSLRMIKVDTDENDNTSFFTVTSQGKSISSVAGSNEHFIISYNDHNTTNKIFCIQTDQTVGEYTPVSTGCETYDADYAAITGFSAASDAPVDVFNTELSDYGL